MSTDSEVLRLLKQLRTYPFMVISPGPLQSGAQLILRKAIEAEEKRLRNERRVSS